jgi:hypothetical protein
LQNLRIGRRMVDGGLRDMIIKITSTENIIPCFPVYLNNIKPTEKETKMEEVIFLSSFIFQFHLNVRVWWHQAQKLKN